MRISRGNLTERPEGVNRRGLEFPGLSEYKERNVERPLPKEAPSMKKAVALVVIALLANVVPILAAAKTAAPQEQTEPTVQAETFKGKVVSTKQKGSMAKPYIAVGVAGDDGKEVIFNLRGNTELTDVDGKSLRSMGSVKKGRTVEVKYTVKDGKNEAISIHYLD
jgi:hypothetical protein